jgi:hypothetical protein
MARGGDRGGLCLLGVSCLETVLPLLEDADDSGAERHAEHGEESGIQSSLSAPDEHGVGAERRLHGNDEGGRRVRAWSSRSTKSRRFMPGMAKSHASADLRW